MTQSIITDLSKSLSGRLCLAFTLLMLTALGACTHENPLSLELEGNLAMVRLPGGGAGITGHCLPEGQAQFRPNGVFDLMITNKYDFYPRIENRLVQTQTVTGMGPESLRGDASTITIDGAQISMELDSASAGPLKPASGAPLWRTTWFSPFQAQVDAGGVVSSRFALVPPDVGSEMSKVFKDFPGKKTASQQAIMKISIIGRMADGTAVESNVIQYPVDICWGCLVTIPVSIEGVDADPLEQYKLCSSKLVNQFTPPCMPGNDEFVPCQFYCNLCHLNGDCDDEVCPTQ